MSSEGPAWDVGSDDADRRAVIIVRATHESACLGTWGLPAGDHLIGRQDDAAIHLPLPQVSRLHATLAVSPSGSIAITDHGSSSGTRIGGEPLDDVRGLELPATIQVADVTLEIVRSHESDATLPAPPAPSEAETRRTEETGGRAEIDRLDRRRLETVSADASAAATVVCDANLRRRVELRRPKAPSHEARFLREARLLARLEHPNIPPVHQLGRDAEGRSFRTAKPRSSQTLATRLDELAAETSLDLESRLGLFQRIADAVAFAHDKGVVHGRLHPARIQLGDHGEVLVDGWERARDLSAAEAEEERAADDEAMAACPFRATDSAAAPPSDIFSLGAILHCLLRGLPASSFAPASLSRSAPRRVPPALNAVARKAMAEDPDDRYESVADLLDDIDRWKKGYATEAEGAGFMRQFVLLGMRNKVFAAAGLVIVAMAFWFLGNVLNSRAAAVQHIEDLKKHAPLLHQVALGHAERREWKDALDKINAAIELDDRGADHHLLLGEIHMARMDTKAAIVAWRQAEKLGSDPSIPRQYREQAEAFLEAIAASRSFPFLDAEELRRELVAKGRALVAAGFQDKLINEVKKQEKRLLEQLRPLDPAVKFDLNEDFTMSLEMRDGKKLESLDVLAGLPFKSLMINYSPATNLAPLRGMPLEWLHLEGTKVADLKPLEGAPIKTLSLTRTAVTNLLPLKGMPLESLILMDMHAGDLSPLRGMTNLVYLNLYNAWNVEDLSPLEGLPIENLTLYYTKVTDLTPLSHSRLKVMGCRANKISDLSPLRGLPMEHVDFSHTQVMDISPLRDSPVRILRLHYSRVTDIRTVAALKDLEELTTDHTGVKDLRPLLNAPGLKRLTLSEAALQIPANIEIIGRLPRLEQLGSDLVMDSGDRVALKPVAEFWRAYIRVKQQQK